MNCYSENMSRKTKTHLVDERWELVSLVFRLSHGDEHSIGLTEKPEK
jgi:hypothetical protein